MNSASAAVALPVLYSFRRCPYAMRARMALYVSGQRCVLREVVLRSKPAELLEASAKATVPVLVDSDGTVIAESLDIMHWALRRHDPQQWLTPEYGDHAEMLAMVAQIDGPFKFHLDRFKYLQRHDGEAATHRDHGGALLTVLDARLRGTTWLFGGRAALADIAVAPFVRQFAHVDVAWFAAQPWPGLQRWLSAWEASDLLAGVMHKYPAWQSGTPGVPFP